MSFYMLLTCPLFLTMVGNWMGLVGIEIFGIFLFFSEMVIPF